MKLCLSFGCSLFLAGSFWVGERLFLRLIFWPIFRIHVCSIPVWFWSYWPPWWDCVNVNHFPWRQLPSWPIPAAFSELLFQRWDYWYALRCRWKSWYYSFILFFSASKPPRSCVGKACCIAFGPIRRSLGAWFACIRFDLVFFLGFQIFCHSF